MDKWLEKQVLKYAGMNFGETEQTVDKNTQAWRFLCKYAKTGMTFLDLGCNNGRITNEMKQRGLIELGIDLPEIIAKITYPINKQAMDLETQFPTGEFDLIFCRETLEHLRNSEDVCRKILNVLKIPDGIAILACPHDERDFGENCPEHHRLFKGQQLREMIEKLGGVVLEQFEETVCRSRGCVSKRRL